MRPPKLCHFERSRGQFAFKSTSPDYGQPTFWKYTYNSRGEVTQSYEYMGADTADLSKPMSGRLYDFGYDNIGNRTSVNHTGVPGLQENYTANNLNQITSR